MPPHVDTTTVEQELPFGPQDLGIDPADWRTIDATTGEEEGVLKRISEDETARVERWVGVPFSLQNETEILDGDDATDGGYILPLGNIPINSVGRVVADGETWFENDSFLVRESHLEATVERWPYGSHNIRVEYTHGFDGVPDAAESGIIRLIRARLNDIKTDVIEDESVGDASYNWTPSSQIRAEVMAEVKTLQPTTADNSDTRIALI